MEDGKRRIDRTCVRCVGHVRRDGEQGRREDGQNVGRLDRCREYSKREHNTVLCCLLRLKSNITQKNPYACGTTS